MAVASRLAQVPSVTPKSEVAVSVQRVESLEVVKGTRVDVQLSGTSTVSRDPLVPVNTPVEF